MKHIYLIALLFTTSISFAQNDLLGVWFLNQIEVDDVIHPNYYNNTSQFELEFVESSENEGEFDFFGSGPCDSFGGISTASQSTITFSGLNFTLLGPCSNAPEMLFETIYFSIFENQSVPFDFQYVITGENDDQILTITNPVTGDEAVYGRIPNLEELTQTWYLSRIEIPGNPTIEIPVTESPSLTITNDINPLTFKTMAFGDGDCNAFMSDYEVTLNNGNAIQLLDFSPTLAFCTSDYEDEYFSIVGEISNNFSEFEITNNGMTLTMTDLLGARLVFGDEPLSILENEKSALHISLIKNPVASEINLSISQSVNKLNYQIYSIEGKLIKEAHLNSDSINVETLNSGLYFIRFSNNEQQVQTIKFIKQ
ncbi:T9SS type A sorting domain-containing protein [Psychroserpens ponticola]|uniref:T9SS type A sorting domain-containing protein n=1 Tax=Psychroserpens ponticola TaxID=2932268 RepID=A0ABY7S2D0_9FLAO|nr:T9SS type A sorting domain-containing protein [Psychroserpens ponticola]WCO03066.1 T9SS type A sorting domain-containing protein [Psychroserpens ponticola]